MAFNFFRCCLCGLGQANNPQTQRNEPPAAVTLEEYKYTDLREANGDIRLLQISGSAFILQNYALDNAPPYWALSYTWGEAEESTESASGERFYLNFGATNLSIFGNLRRGLAEIQRRNDTIQGPVHVWADAVCINQGNVDEVNAQVNIMDQIYSRAAAVLVWLGPDNSGEISFVEDILVKFERMHLSIADISTREEIKPGEVVRRDMVNLLSAVHLPPVDDDIWRALLAFFGRLWFRRLWIVQEVALAQEVMVWCGSETLSWTAIERCAEILNCGLEKAILAADRSRTDTAVRFHSRYAGLITHIRKYVLNDDLPVEFADVYKLITGREKFDPSFAYFLIGYLSASMATDPRDKIYGILGMLRKLAPAKSPLMAVDYRLDASQVYIEATKKILTQLNWLGFLSLVTTAEGLLRSQLPSWVPDLTPTSVHNFSVESDPEFNAAGRFRVDHTAEDAVRLVIEETRLQLPGNRVAIVRSKSERLQEFYDHKASFEKGIKVILELGGNVKYFLTRESLVDAAWKTLIANDLSGMSEADGRASFESYWLLKFLFLAVLEWNSKKTPVEIYLKTIPSVEILSKWNESSFLPGHAAVVDAFKKMQQDKAWVNNSLAKDALPYSLAAGNWVPSRVLFNTREGYLGIGHESLQEGDEVWVTPNGPVPLILRPIHNSGHADHFRLVGESYVHGIMYGELFKDGTPSWERIWLV